MTEELGKIVRPKSPTASCQINEDDKHNISLILSETKVMDNIEDAMLKQPTTDIVCALSSKTVYLSNSGQIISNIDLPYYWCNFCTFKTEEKQSLLRHLMEHRFSCQFCLYQTFSRVDVVRHMVNEHEQFDGGELKFCVLLPDLLKQKMKQSEMANIVNEKINHHKNQSPPSKPSNKRRRNNSVDEDSSSQKMISNHEGKKKPRGRNERSASDTAGSDSKHEDNDNSRITRNMHRRSNSPMTSFIETQLPKLPRSPKVGEKNSKSEKKLPSVCIECSVCRHRTFKKAYLLSHTLACHQGDKPKFALKIVSQSQAVEIFDNDEQFAIKSAPDAKLKAQSMKKKSKKGKGQNKDKSCLDPPSSPCLTLSAVTADEYFEDDEQPSPLVEMDTAEEYYDEDMHFAPANSSEDEDYEPLSKLKQNAETTVKSKVQYEVCASKHSLFTCLLCTTYADYSFEKSKEHYKSNHPGGTLVMKHTIANNGTENWVYFCNSDTCSFRHVNPLLWLDHCKICRKTAFDSVNSTDIIDISIINTAQAVKENVQSSMQPCVSEPRIGLLVESTVKTEPTHNSTSPLKASSNPLYNIIKPFAKNSTVPRTEQSSRSDVQFHSSPNLLNDKYSSTTTSSTLATDECSETSRSTDVQEKDNSITDKELLCKEKQSSDSKCTSLKAKCKTKTTSQSPGAVKSQSATKTKKGQARVANVKLSSSTDQDLHPEEMEAFNTDQHGHYKCAHCRFEAEKVLETKKHLIDRHTVMPLYAVDMMADKNQVPRFILCCPKVKCDFSTKGKDLFLNHLKDCSCKEKQSSENLSRAEVTKFFAASTLEKLLQLT